MVFSTQECWSGLPFPFPVDHIWAELSTMTGLTWVALHGMAHSFIELDKAVVHVISLISSNLPWFMDLTFQVPMQHCCLQHWTLLYSQSHPHWMLFLLWLHLFILSVVISPLISSSILGTYRPEEFLFQYPIILPFHTVHGVLKARMLKCFAIPFPFSRGPHFVRTLHHDSSILGGPTWHGS